MSIINDMLRDLDQRAALPQGSPAEVASGNTIARAKTGLLPSVKISLVFLAVVAMGITLNSQVNYSSRSPQLKHSEPSTAHVVQKTPVPATSERAAPYAETVAGSEVVTASPQPSESADQPEVASKESLSVSSETGTNSVASLLEKAARALQRNRLTLPAGASARDYYREVLQLEPQNTAALAGLQDINRRYEQLIEARLQAGEFDRAQTLLTRAKSEALAIDLPRLAQQLERTRVAQQQMVTVEPKEPTTTNSVSITPTLHSKDRAIAESAWRSFSDGDATTAIATLENFLGANPQAQKSRLRLFDIYLAQRDYQAAQQQLGYWDVQPVQQRYLQSRFLAAQGDQLQALNQLEQTGTKRLNELLAANIIDKELFEQYSALQAALYQATENNLAAAEKYQMLVGFAPQNSKYWLGYAVSSDALGHYQNALAAYQRLSLDETLKPRVRQFVAERLTVLQTHTPEQHPDVAER